MSEPIVFFDGRSWALQLLTPEMLTGEKNKNFLKNPEDLRKSRKINEGASGTSGSCKWLVESGKTVSGGSVAFMAVYFLVYA